MSGQSTNRRCIVKASIILKIVAVIVVAMFAGTIVGVVIKGAISNKEDRETYQKMVAEKQQKIPILGVLYEEGSYFVIVRSGKKLIIKDVFESKNELAGRRVDWAEINLYDDVGEKDPIFMVIESLDLSGVGRIFIGIHIHSVGEIK